MQINSTIQPHEIARLIRGAQIPRQITNPIGLLITAIPAKCTDDSIAIYRAHWQKEDDEASRYDEEKRAAALELATRILNGVSNGEDWAASDIEWAKTTLTQNA